jgi:hypothetical protein
MAETRRAVIKNPEMADGMQQDAIDCAIAVSILHGKGAPAPSRNVSPR